MSKPPIEVPQGAIRFNTDSQKLEFFAQDQWWEMATDALNIGGNGNASTDPTGNSADQVLGHRGLIMGGSSYTDTIEYITMASKGNPIDFGNLTQSRFTPAGAASNTRGVFMGGYTPSPGKGVNTIDYVEIMSLGNAIDFGDDQYGRYQPNGCSSPTRGIIAAGQLDSPATLDVGYVDYITIASKGNATTFGELGIDSYGPFSAASSTRGVFGGSQLHMKSIHYITMASTGNGIYFGDLSTPFTSCASGTVSTQTRGIAAGGRNPSNVNTIESVEIATTGNAVDFGDRIKKSQQFGGCSDSHGGLGGF